LTNGLEGFGVGLLFTFAIDDFENMVELVLVLGI
jgi:hypothetical protein